MIDTAEAAGDAAAEDGKTLINKLHKAPLLQSAKHILCAGFGRYNQSL